jgi:hypothetical protein
MIESLGFANRSVLKPAEMPTRQQDDDTSMKLDPPTPEPADREHLRQRLSALRIALLALHKTLVDSERVSYEKTVGPIQSPNHFLQLLTRDAWFAWLQPFSQLIVALDEAQEEKEPLTSAGLDALVQQARDLLVATENGEGFPGNYFVALQRDADVVMAHATVAKLIKPPASPALPHG